MMAAAPIPRDGDRHLTPSAYYSLSALAAVIGLSASIVTVQMLGQAIQATEQTGPARELLQWASALFVCAELAACLIAGLLPVQRLRALRWRLIVIALALVAFEVAAIYGARVVLLRAADTRANAQGVQAEQLRASIDAHRRNAAALVEAGQRSSQSVIASSRADGARSLRDAVELEAQARRMAADLVRIEAARAPTLSQVFGPSGVIALAVAQSLLVSIVGLLFVGAAGALARAARDAATDAPDALAYAPPMQAAAPVRAPVAVEQFQGTPAGTVPAVPGRLHRYAVPSLVAGAGVLAFGGPTLADPLPMTLQARAAAGDAAAKQADAPTDAPMQQASDDAARFLIVREGIEGGRIKPSLRGIYAAVGASQEVARRYLVELEQAGVIEKQGRGYRLATNTGRAAA